MSGINSAILWDPSASTTQNTGQSQATSTSTDTQSVTETEFLNLLVAQLQNQDPLNPVDSQDFVTQLATINSLQQLIDINKGVTTLAGGTDQQTSNSTNNTAVS